eukprot:TRINITY_DN93_c2_g2_i2.p1 TRINITY_DN93_c2_g2~~TRINITY_DN93_c2_g2_i2.p1  ORF type:complete len:150 (+),score=58.83 TRINITY_DN93_c2_g2_i2:567-1016(+)
MLSDILRRTLQKEHRDKRFNDERLKGLINEKGFNAKQAILDEMCAEKENLASKLPAAVMEIYDSDVVAYNDMAQLHKLAIFHQNDKAKIKESYSPFLNPDTSVRARALRDLHPEAIQEADLLFLGELLEDLPEDLALVALKRSKHSYSA